MRYDIWYMILCYLLGSFFSEGQGFQSCISRHCQARRPTGSLNIARWSLAVAEGRRSLHFVRQNALKKCTYEIRKVFEDVVRICKNSSRLVAVIAWVWIEVQSKDVEFKKRVYRYIGISRYIYIHILYTHIFNRFEMLDVGSWSSPGQSPCTTGASWYVRSLEA